MLFSSFEFAVFLPVVFLIYWYLKKSDLKIQNSFLLMASFVFYSWWSWKFLFLLLFIATSNYFIGIELDKRREEGNIKIWLITGLILNIGTLAVFKYFNFFIDSFIDLVSLSGFEITQSSVKIVLPLGISFYTFLSLSYIIDIYKHKINAEKDAIAVLLSLCFFPIILAGPIQRPSLLLPQIKKRREFTYNQIVDGLRQILWGLFVKVVIADNLAPHVDDIFAGIFNYSGSTLMVGIVFYTLQIYADFSGYSNIAIGVAKILGFNLMQNFKYPYFSRDITEFWKKWHISLTTWFRDYIFLPISFEISWKIKKEKVLFIKADRFIYIIASIVTWFLTGLWHGANYTFIIWGLINGFFLILYHLQVKPRKRLFKKIGINNDHIIVLIIETIVTLSIIMLSWIFFRSDTINHALLYIRKMFSLSLFSIPEVFPKKVIVLMILFIMAEWIQKGKEHALQITNIKSKLIRWCIYVSIFELVLFMGGGNHKFIYFQF